MLVSVWAVTGGQSARCEDAPKPLPLLATGSCVDSAGAVICPEEAPNEAACRKLAETQATRLRWKKKGHYSKACRTFRTPIEPADQTAPK